MSFNIEFSLKVWMLYFCSGHLHKFCIKSYAVNAKYNQVGIVCVRDILPCMPKNVYISSSYNGKRCDCNTYRQHLIQWKTNENKSSQAK